MYLDLIEEVLINSIYEDPGDDYFSGNTYDPARREIGWDWPSMAHSMIGRRRMRNLRECVETVLRDGVPGDIAETGVWRGGASIYVRAILKAHQVFDRVVWAADSYKGLPPPDPDFYPADAGSIFHTYTQLAVSLAVVKKNFAKYGLLDDQVRFLEGWFSETLQQAPIERLAVLRLDGDLYESTMDGLLALYPKVSDGGFVIVDDYYLPPCRQAVHDYLDEVGHSASIDNIDGIGSFWRKRQA